MSEPIAIRFVVSEEDGTFVAFCEDAPGLVECSLSLDHLVGRQVIGLLIRKAQESGWFADFLKRRGLPAGTAPDFSVTCEYRPKATLKYITNSIGFADPQEKGER